MGVVFRGYDASIGRPVAVKVIRPHHGFTDEQAAEARLRFSREASAAGRLSHPNIVTIYQMGEDRGYQYMTMEFVEGVPLNQLIVPGAPMKVETVLDIVRQIADALDHAHQQEVVHRDIKPPNVLVKPDGRVKIADFGIARVASQTLTLQGTTLGTPAYMAPEQIRGSKVDGRADQYSLAVLAYQMLCGQRPFEAATEQALIFQIVLQEPKPIREANPALPAACAAVLARAMSKDPAARYGSCTEFSRSLSASFAPAPVPAAPPKKSAVGKLVLAGIAVVLAAGLASVFLSHQSAPAPRTVAPPISTPPPAQATPQPVEQAPPPVPIRKPAAVKPAAKEAAPPLTPEQLQAQQERRQEIAELETRHRQLQTELDQAQLKLDALRQRYKDSFPDVQNAIQVVNATRKKLDDTTTELNNLKAAG